MAAAGRAAGRAAAADDRDMELAELDSRIVAALNRARAVAAVNATFPNLSSNDKPMQENRGSSPRIFAQSPDLDKIDSWSSRRS